MTKLTVGFAGMGIMGTPMARNLMKSGRFADVYVWNRTLSKCDELVAEGAKRAETPAELVQKCDIVFGMLADPDAALSAVFSPNGILEACGAGKAYVDMSTVSKVAVQAGAHPKSGPGQVNLPLR